MKNSAFRNQWINRMCDYLNSSLSPENVIKLVNQITTRIKNEVDRDRDRWKKEMLYVKKNERVAWIKDYAVKRPVGIIKEIKSIFNLPGEAVSVNINSNIVGGKVRVNSLVISNEEWTGMYFENIPITIEAIPNKGYYFYKWKQKKRGKKKLIEVSPKKSNQFTPIFKLIKNK
jgi:hypothetical protein